MVFMANPPSCCEAGNTVVVPDVDMGQTLNTHCAVDHKERALWAHEHCMIAVQSRLGRRCYGHSEATKAFGAMVNGALAWRPRVDCAMPLTLSTALRHASTRHASTRFGPEAPRPDASSPDVPSPDVPSPDVPWAMVAPTDKKQ
jgi:hypothetical protein